MPSLKNSLLESFYLIFMFLFFKTSIDFNVLSSPKGSWLEHLIGDEYGLRICPFGRVAIFALIFILVLGGIGGLIYGLKMKKNPYLYTAFGVVLGKGVIMLKKK